jgi:hypothetical protein
MKTVKTQGREGQEQAGSLPLLSAVVAAMLPLAFVIATLAALVPAFAGH